MLAHQTFHEGQQTKIARICSWCGRQFGVKYGVWTSDLPAESHGICPKCEPKTKEEIANARREAVCLRGDVEELSREAVS